jgi:hypothetical protein
MGLDMYLEARKYVSGYSHRPIDDQNEYEETLALVGLTKADLSTEASPSATIAISVAYWRKANSIHQWFVNNVQDGEDNCQTAFLERDKLAELLEVCRQVKADHALAEELLPPQEGFFFGGTEIDENYFYDINNTIGQLEKLLNNPKFDGWDFSYHSSW